MSLRPINNHILFKFVDEINNLNNQFAKGVSPGGIVLIGDTFDESAKQARWVKIQYAGPGVKTVRAGQTVLVQALRWTEGVKYEGSKVWRTDEKELVAVLNADGSMTPLGDFALFTQNTTDHIRKHGQLIVVGGVENTPSGTVFAVGPKAEPALVGATIYYSGANFTETAKANGKDFAFIREEGILAYTQE